MSQGESATLPLAPTRRRILDASRRLFAERGYHGTTVRDIAGRVGVTDGALYRHFRSKRELLEALLEDAGLSAAYRELAAVPDTIPLERALTGMTLSALRFMEEHREVLKILILEGILGDAAVREEYQSVTARWVDGVARIIEHRAAAEALSPSLARPLAVQIVAFLWGTFVERLLGITPAVFLDETGKTTPAAREYAQSSIQRLLYGVSEFQVQGSKFQESAQSL